MRSHSSGIVTVLLLLACTPAAAEEAFSGTGRAIDGDSLMVGQREVRLFGIDAPEFDQTCNRNGAQWRCGAAAARELGSLVDGKEVRCEQVDSDEHGRQVARCKVGAVDVNRTMVALGYATAYRRYSDNYVSAEAAAKGNKLGLWSGTFQLPSEYRHADEPAQQARRARQAGRSDARPALSVRAGCVIKGNRGSNGWIYHMPGMPFYERTKPEEMFCSEAEAQTAGYRRAKVR